MSNWPEFKISNIIIEQSKSKLQVQNAIDHGSYPFFTSGEKILRHTEYTTEGDNIFLATGGVANVKYYSGKCAYSTDTYVLKCQDFDTKYFYYFLLEKRDFINNNLFSGSGLKHLQKKDFYKICFKAPDNTAEQRKIAQILSTTDTVIEKTQAAIAKYKAIKQGMLNDLFTRGVDTKTGKLRPTQQDAPELYKESELGWIPKEWDALLLNEVIDPIMSNVDKHIKDDETKVLLCNYMDVYSNRYLTPLINYSAGSVNFSELNRFLLKLEDVIITKDSETPDDIAVPSVVYDEFKNLVCGYHLCILRSKNQEILEGEYLMLQLQLHEINKQFAIRANGSTRYGLTIKGIESVYLKIPKDITEQKEISKRLKTVDNKLASEQNYLLKLQQIKSGLMADLLSGKKLVTVTEELETKIN